MTSLTLDIQGIFLILTTLLIGLAAGLCFTWTNAVTTGIGRLEDVNYLQAFQQMNRTILNPQFFIVFLGSFILSIVTLFLYRSYPNYIMWCLAAAVLLYFFGVVLVTFFGNVPLNELLDKTELSNINIENAKSLRDRFEVKWNRLHLIRTISSILAFLLLLITCLLKSNAVNP